jgi:hypothetical protein
VSVRAVLIAICIGMVSRGNAQKLYTEDFEGLKLGPNVEERWRELMSGRRRAVRLGGR